MSAISQHSDKQPSVMILFACLDVSSRSVMRHSAQSWFCSLKRSHCFLWFYSFLNMRKFQPSAAFSRISAKAADTSQILFQICESSLSAGVKKKKEKERKTFVCFYFFFFSYNKNKMHTKQEEGRQVEDVCFAPSDFVA